MTLVHAHIAAVTYKYCLPVSRAAETLVVISRDPNVTVELRETARAALQTVDFASWLSITTRVHSSYQRSAFSYQPDYSRFTGSRFLIPKRYFFFSSAFFAKLAASLSRTWSASHLEIVTT